MDGWQPVGRQDAAACTTQMVALLVASLGVWYGLYRLARWAFGV